MRSDFPPLGDFEHGDLAGSTPGRHTLRPLELKRERARRRARDAACASPEGREAPGYLSPVCDRPPPPETLAAQIAFHAEGPGIPGDADYLAGGGPGHRERFREARAVFYWKGGTRQALEAAADHGSWEPREMILILLREGDILPWEALLLQAPGCPLEADRHSFAALVGACAVAGCRNHPEAGRAFPRKCCSKHRKSLAQ